MRAGGIWGHPGGAGGVGGWGYFSSQTGPRFGTPRQHPSFERGTKPERVLFSRKQSTGHSRASRLGLPAVFIRLQKGFKENVKALASETILGKGPFEHETGEEHWFCERPFVAPNLMLSFDKIWRCGRSLVLCIFVAFWQHLASWRLLAPLRGGLGGYVGP